MRLFHIPDDLYSMYNVVRMQHEALRKIEALDSVCLGSSHAFMDFFAEGNEFNLGASSADLYIADQLHRFVTGLHPKIKNVILFYDVFSAGFELEKTLTWYKQVPYEMLYGVPWRDLSLNRRIQSIAMRRALEKIPAPIIPEGCRGNSAYDWFSPPDTSVVERVRGHLKHAFRNGRQLRWVESIARRAETHGQNLVVVLSPNRADYSMLLPPSACLYHDLFRCLEGCNGDVSVMDTVGCEEINDDDFGDMDHLNENGAKKFSAMIRNGLR